MLQFQTLLVIIVFLLETLVLSDTKTQTQTCHVDEEGNQKCEAGTIIIDDTSNEEEENEIDYLYMLKERNYDCTNQNKDDSQCDRWAKNGECDKNTGYMILNCAKSCGYCHLKDPNIRCKRHPKAPPALSKPGEINAMFERIMTSFPQYTPKALSRDPWVVELHNVFGQEEANRLVDIAGVNFRRSVDAGKMKGEGAQFEAVVSDARTSSTSWCTYTRNCWNDPLVEKLWTTAQNITMIPPENSEFFQVLRYEVGQYYVKHHDYIPGHLDLPIGPRLYTYFLYLGKPEEGGGTSFPRLNITVEPELGKVAIWPSVLNSDPMKKDSRTMHEALPVTSGIKYGANMWLHMFNFHEPYKIMCTG